MKTIEELKEKVRVERARHKFSTKNDSDRYLHERLTKDWFENWATMVKEEKV